MGTINYSTSDYITLGIVPLSVWDLENNLDFMNEIRAEVKEYGGTVEEAIDSYISDYHESDYTNAEDIISRYAFWYYHVELNPGYYEGFFVKITSHLPDTFYNCYERQDINKEISQLKKCLLELVENGPVACSPGWCTGYNDYKGTCKAIEAAIKVMRDEVRTIPTWRQYERKTAKKAV